MPLLGRLIIFRRGVAFLQNAWSGYYAARPGRRWPRERWLAALKRSRSGQRLETLEKFCPGLELWYDNTTQACGALPESTEPPDTLHIVAVLRQQKPDVVVALGRQAAVAVTPLLAATVPLLILPHPAYRVVTNALYRNAGQLLHAGFLGVIELRQGRGSVEVIRRWPAPADT